MKTVYEISIPAEQECEHIGKMLLAYNLSVHPLEQEKAFIDINRCVKDSNGEVIGGILAIAALWNVLHIDTMWVKKEFQNKGIATQLLIAVEDYARDSGCHLSYLETYDFQAKDFYLKNGYTIFGTLEDCPKGHKCYYLSKKL